ncbi:hypothetical protein ACEK06_11610 [Pseudomonas brenneri]|uniref:hypothetical protein n=1 Tax=Pseudomonas brenneri TaxID=129817 RepID=UPI003570CD2C
MKKIKPVSCICFVIFCSSFYIDARAGDSIGDTIIPGYSQRNLLRNIDSKGDADVLLWRNKLDSKELPPGMTVDLDFLALDSPKLRDNGNPYGCIKVGRPLDSLENNVFIYVDKISRSPESGYGVFADYPSNFICKPDSREIDRLLANRIASERQSRIELLESERLSKLAPGQCDGKQMYGYVSTALDAGNGVLNVANNEAYGGGAVGLALTSSTMGIYNSAVVNMREHDLSLARSGCKSLSGGPTQAMLKSFKEIDFKIRRLVGSQYNQPGVITNGFGGVK